MSGFRKYVQEVAVESVVLVLGWLFCITVLAGAFALGRWAVPYLGWTGSPDTFGILSVLTSLWIYEHRNIEGKYDRLRELMDHVISKA
jgi:hypothetical protein